MKRFLTVALLAGGLGLGLLESPPGALAATFTPPGLSWRTLQTAHFRIHFPEDLRDIARKAARYAEEAHERLGPYFGRENDVTDVTILDTEDTTNGFATPFPETSLTFFVTPPSPEEDWYLGRYDNWLKMIVVHEYTHVLHLRSAAGPGGVAGFINSAFLRAFLPEFSPLVNLDFLPDFMKEGLAVYWESALTGGGRAMEGQFDMVLRSQFAAGKPFGIDQASGKYYLDWAPGGVSYSYGTLFFKYLAAQYGDNAAADLTRGLGQFPWTGINAASSRTLGNTTYEIWDQTIDYFETRYKRQVAEISATPVTKAKPVTTDGRIHRHPKWLSNDRLIYSRSPLEGSVGLLSSNLDGSDVQFVLGKASRRDYSLTADGSQLYYYSGGDGPALTSFFDIYRMDVKSKKSKQVTHGQRAFCPAVRPDGKQVFVVLNGQGRNDLGMIDEYGKLLWRYRGPEMGSFSNPVWSPDGKRIALSQWTDGRTNIKLFDPETRTFTAVAPEDAVQLFPAWSPDGKYLLFSSDRSGVMNLHAARLADGKLFGLSNVVGGAFDPAVSPDQTKLAFSEYEENGWNVKVMPFRPETWTEVPAALSQVPDVLQASRLRLASAGGSDAGTAAEAHNPSQTGDPSSLSGASQSKPGAANWQIAGTPDVIEAVPAPGKRFPPEAFPVVTRGERPAKVSDDVAEAESALETPYNPLPSMLPQNLWPRIILDLDNNNSVGPGLPEIGGVVGHMRGAGPAIAIQGYGQDVLRQHTYFGSLGLYAGISRFAGALSYTNDQFPPSLSVGMSVSPSVIGEGSGAGAATKLLLGREERSVFAGVSYPPYTSALLGNWLTGMVGNLNFTARQFVPFYAGAEYRDFEGPLPLSQSQPIFLPEKVNTIALQVFGNETDRPLRAFSPVGGPLWTVGVSRSDKLIGSDLGYWKTWAEGRQFVTLGGRNVLALRGMTGYNFTDPQSVTSAASRIYLNNTALDRNMFFMGEFVATTSYDIGIGRASSAAIHSLADLRTIGEPDALVPLRGFPIGVSLGNHVALFSAEYRIPLFEIQRGLGTFPLFFDRVSVAPFVDVGKAWTVWDSMPLLAGVGAETRIHVNLAQGIPSEFRVGLARGIGPLGVNQVILGIGAVF